MGNEGISLSFRDMNQGLLLKSGVTSTKLSAGESVIFAMALEIRFVGGKM